LLIIAVFHLVARHASRQSPPPTSRRFQAFTITRHGKTKGSNFAKDNQVSRPEINDTASILAWRRLMIRQLTLAFVATVLASGLAWPAFADCLESGAAECGDYGASGYAPSVPDYQPYGVFRYHGFHMPIGDELSRRCSGAEVRLGG
jgi:hypothetical protein